MKVGILGGRSRQSYILSCVTCPATGLVKIGMIQGSLAIVNTVTTKLCEQSIFNDSNVKDMRSWFTACAPHPPPAHTQLTNAPCAHARMPLCCKRMHGRMRWRAGIL